MIPTYLIRDTPFKTANCASFKDTSREKDTQLNAWESRFDGRPARKKIGSRNKFTGENAVLRPRKTTERRWKRKRDKSDNDRPG